MKEENCYSALADTYNLKVKRKILEIFKSIDDKKMTKVVVINPHIYLLMKIIMNPNFL